MPNSFQPSKSNIQNKELHYWPQQENYRGFVSTSESTSSNGTIIIFHGNAETAYYRYYYIKPLQQRGLRVILAEYPGYGGRPGKISENTLVNDALDTIQLAYQEYGEPLFLWGESLGNGIVASAVAKTQFPIKGIVLFLAWDSLANVAQFHYWYLPSRYLLKDKYNNTEHLKQFSGNVAVVLATQDKIIPPKFGENLYHALETNKKLWLLHDEGHNSISMDASLYWWDEIITFIRHAK